MSLDENAKVEIIENNKESWGGALQKCGKDREGRIRKGNWGYNDKGKIGENNAIKESILLHKYRGHEQMYSSPSEIINYMILQ